MALQKIMQMNNRIVTDVAGLSGGRYKVYIDQEFAFVLYKSELRQYGISADHEISDEHYDEIIHRVLPKRAKLRAMALLQKRCYTEKQLTDKLKEGLYSKAVIEEALSYVKSFGYVDDLQFAVDYITYHEEARSGRRIICDLQQKGIDENVIRQAFDKWKELGGCQNEQEMIRAVLEKKNYNSDCSLKERQKIYAFLLRKGFSIENVNKVLGRMDSFT